MIAKLGLAVAVSICVWNAALPARACPRLTRRVAFGALVHLHDDPSVAPADLTVVALPASGGVERSIVAVSTVGVDGLSQPALTVLSCDPAGDAVWLMGTTWTMPDRTEEELVFLGAIRRSATPRGDGVAVQVDRGRASTVYFLVPDGDRLVCAYRTDVRDEAGRVRAMWRVRAGRLEVRARDGSRWTAWAPAAPQDC